MYSVIRFSGPQESLDLVGQKLNSIISGSYEGPDKVAGRFSCSVSTSDQWSVQLRAVIDWLTRADNVLNEARASGFDLEVDFAVGPEEYQGRWLTEFRIDSELIAILLRYQIEFVISVYGDGELK
jgi:hypothetical protein